MTTWRFAERLGEQLQLLVLQITRHRTRHGGIQQSDAPVTNIDHRLQKITVHSSEGHDLRFVVIARNPACRHADLLGHIAKLLIRLQRTVLGQVPCGQHQVDLRLLRTHQVDHPLQAFMGVHAQQRAVGLGKQVAVGQLHQQRRRIGGHGGYARQALSQGNHRNGRVA